VVQPESIVLKPVIKPKPIVKKPIIKKPKKVKKKIKKSIKKKKVKKRSVKKRKNRNTKKSTTRSRVKTNPVKKSQFLSKLRAKINRAKSYPRIAQRRGMQGVVKIRFTILANGNVGNISVSGPKVFRNSARLAVKSAFPITTKNAPFSLPTTVNLLLRYQLK
jgi:protein TonB